MAQEFAPGQVWSYEHAEPGSSRVIIGKIDHFEGQQEAVVSILVTDVPIPTTYSTHQTIRHTPIEEEALRKSVVALEGKTQVPHDFTAGYQQWREVFDRGEAGYFTIPVHEIVQAIGQAMSQPQTLQ